MWLTVFSLLLLQSVYGKYVRDQHKPRRELEDYGKIIGGRFASYGEFPFMLSLEAEGFGHYCGASAIGDYWALTAAHCAMSDFGVVVRAGSLKSGDGGTVHNVEKFITQELDMNFNFDNDISVIKLKEPFTINRYVKYISLPMQGELVHVGDKFNVSGWGYTIPGDFDSASTDLKVAEVVALKPEECQNNPNVGGQILITENMICAQQKEHSAYKGDSGGPLFTVQDGKVKQLGVVSWGDSTGMQAHPAIFTRIASYRVWIYMKTGI